jgi:hypothetical protein
MQIVRHISDVIAMVRKKALFELAAEACGSLLASASASASVRGRMGRGGGGGGGDRAAWEEDMVTRVGTAVDTMYNRHEHTFFVNALSKIALHDPSSRSGILTGDRVKKVCV